MTYSSWRSEKVYIFSGANNQKYGSRLGYLNMVIDILILIIHYLGLALNIAECLSTFLYSVL